MRLTLICASRYFRRYIERELTHSHLRRTWNPINGWKDVVKKNWDYNEHRPWTSEFKQFNQQKPRKYVPVEPIKEWSIFKGDRVQILVGPDKGKHGLINCIIKERNWVFVEGLNCSYTMRQQSPTSMPVCIKDELPLLVTKQVALVDPSDNLPTKIEWRYTEDGKRVRVSTRTGRIIPLPSGFHELEDLANPLLYSSSDKDTLNNEVKKVTFVPKLCTFEEDISNEMGIKDDRKPAKTYWY
ncbi:hypothetical protein HELRODRAFT_84263 [Helobdella robusta]|uniref:Large ribosomal subunit protein uL24 C-terminal domain-containing protein n=1 Tax=Helobdella robusta TaxID=6412 RepID=T1G5G6_HELRO|nr:hypothetical protein HELRODRAFT_84263 [Helobdella robusta]ESN99519.1 hypothetical protein HELRODRAFT_84263 [Helobdella robusta]